MGGLAMMKKWIKKKPVLLAVALLVSAGLFGCGKKEGNGNTVSKDYVYRATELGLKDDGEQSINQIFRGGDAIYAYGSRWTDEGENVLSFYEIREDGTIGDPHEIRTGLNTNINRILMDEDANLYCIKNVYYYPPETEDAVVEDGSGADSDDASTETEEPVEGDVQEDAAGPEPRSEEGEEAEAEEGEETGEGTEAGADSGSETEGEAAALEESAEEGEAAVEEPIAEEGEYIDDYYLIKMNLDGEELFSVKLNDVPQFQDLAEENGYFYVGDMYLDRGKALYFNLYSQLFKFDLEGNFVKSVTAKGQQNPFEDVSSFIPLDDGRMVAVIYEETGMSLALADLEAGTLGDRYVIPGRSSEYTYYPGLGYDLYLAGTYGLYGYNLGDEDKTPIMSSMDSDFSFYGIYQVMGLNEREFLAITSDWETGDTLTKFTKVDPEDVKEKQVITLAMASTDWGVRRLAIQFNKSSEDYRISILDYDSLYGTEDDWRAGLTRLNTDIVSGKVPDIILLDNTMPVDSYISKGLFADLKPFIEEDEAFALEDFMPNIIEAYSVEGKLYSLVPSFSIDTLVAKTSEVGKERGWTVKEVQELLASKPEETQFLVNVTRDAMLQYCFTISGSQFIDWDKGTCNFNTDDFIQMLEFIKTFPEEVNWETMPDDFWDSYDSMWREGRAVAQFASIGDLRNFNSMEKGTFGEEITMIGFPSSDGDGSAIWPNLRFALSDKSKNKDGAWEFLRTFLLDEYQETIEYGFPLSVKFLKEQVQKAMERPYYMDENNNKVEYDETAYVNGVEVIISPITKERADEILAELSGFTQIYRADDTLLTIVQEESAPYFAGQKSAKEVASIIQSRVQIYVNENR